MIGAVILVALVLLSGLGLLRLLGVPRSIGALSTLGWSWTLGAFCVSLVMLAWSAAGFVGRAPLALFAALTVICAILLVLGSRRGDCLTVPSVADSPRWERVVLGLALFLGLANVAAVALQIAGTPALDGDEAHFWALKAKMIFSAGGLGEEYRALAKLPTHSQNLDYPPLNPLLQLMVFELRGEITHAFNRLLVVMFAPALVLSLAGAVARVSRPLVAAIIVLGVSASDVLTMYAGRAMSDVIVATAAVSALHAGLLARGDVRWLRMTFLFGAVAVFAKHDAKLMLVAAAAASALVLFLERSEQEDATPGPRAIRALLAPGPLRGALPWVLAPVGVIALVARLNAAVGARNNFDGGQADGASLLGRILEQAPQDLGTVLAHLGEHIVLAPHYAGFIPLAFLALLLAAPRSAASRELRIPSLSLAFACAGLALVFCGLPHDLAWHLQTAAERVYFQVVPSMGVWVAAAGAHAAPALFRGTSPAATTSQC